MTDRRDNETGDDSVAKQCKAEELIVTWEMSNGWLSQVMKERGMSSLYLPTSKSLPLWQYPHAEEQLQDEYPDAFVPTPFLLQETTTGHLVTVIT